MYLLINNYRNYPSIEAFDTEEDLATVLVERSTANKIVIKTDYIGKRIVDLADPGRLPSRKYFIDTLRGA